MLVSLLKRGALVFWEIFTDWKNWKVVFGQCYSLFFVLLDPRIDDKESDHSFRGQVKTTKTTIDKFQDQGQWQILSLYDAVLRKKEDYRASLGRTCTFIHSMVRLQADSLGNVGLALPNRLARL